MAKLTQYQIDTLVALHDGAVMLRGELDSYFWQDSNKRCSVVARNLAAKGLIRNVYINHSRDLVKLTDKGLELVDR